MAVAARASDLVIVAAGKGAVSQLFARDAARSPYFLEAFEREYQGQRMLCAFNLSATPSSLSLPDGSWQVQALDRYANASVIDGQAALPAWGVLFANAG